MKVLIVDEENFAVELRAAASDVLDRADVGWRRTPREALRALERHQPRVLIAGDTVDDLTRLVYLAKGGPEVIAYSTLANHDLCEAGAAATVERGDLDRLAQLVRITLTGEGAT